ncbi:MAG: AraC family transcriptional regulator [Trichormus sp. ATA11-4-KO1]|jgi:AraC family transcriptional regulator|nr:AraC family transcriptional regulator [Trichormus sp. ATA11-4-KO1]
MKSAAVITSETIKESEHHLNLPVVSSKQRGWDNILVEQFHQPPGQIKMHNSSEHMICVSLAPRPIKLVQVKGERIHQGLHAKGDISLTPAGLPIAERWENDDHYLRICLSSSFVQTIANEAFEIDPSQFKLFPEFCARDQHIENFAMMLLSELHNESLGGQLYVESLTNALAVHLLRNYSDRTHRVSNYSAGLSVYQLLQVTDYINDHLAEKIKLADIAQSIGMSKFYFSRLFKQSTGISPSVYVIQQRVEKAKQLLNQQKLTIADVALLCGFNSQSHLGKCFQQLTRMTPKAYRNQ